MVIIYFVIGLVGVFLLAGGIRLHARARASERWPRVEGKVITSEPVGYRGEKYAHVEFEYSARGKTYTSNRLGVVGSDAGSFFDPRASTILTRYPLSTPVSVSYDPDNPSFAVLEPGLSRQGRATLVAGTVLGALFIVIGVVGAAASIS